MSDKKSRPGGMLQIVIKRTRSRIRASINTGQTAGGGCNATRSDPTDGPATCMSPCHDGTNYCSAM
jgi:hypothetical protein